MIMETQEEITGNHKLTPKQAKFVIEYMVDLNATQSAIRAGYSENAASEIGHENLRKPQILEEIKKHIDARAERTLLTADYVVIGLKELFERCMQRTKVMIRDGKSWKQKTEFNDNNEAVGVWQFDSMGANKALDSLCRHLGIFNDKPLVETHLHITTIGKLHKAAEEYDGDKREASLNIIK